MISSERYLAYPQYFTPPMPTSDEVAELFKSLLIDYSPGTTYHLVVKSRALTTTYDFDFTPDNRVGLVSVIGSPE